MSMFSQTEFLPPLMNRAATPTVWSAMVAFSNVNLERIAAVNQLSREICEFHYPPGEAIQKMKSCSTLLSEKQLLRHLASGFGCAAFTLLFGGKYLDCFFSLLLELPCSPFCTMPEYGSPPAFFIRLPQVLS